MPLPMPISTDKTNLGNGFKNLGQLVLVIPLSAAATQPGANVANMSTSVATICGILNTALQAGHVTLNDRIKMAAEFNKIAKELSTPP